MRANFPIRFLGVVIGSISLLFPVATYAANLPGQFFGMTILHAINRTPWPDVKIASIRLWDSDGTGWPQIQPAPGKFNWDGLDRWLALAQRNNADVIYTFGRVPKWANEGKHQSVPPTDLKVWDDFVRAIVRHANGRISAWELWNEPNDPNFWSGDIQTLRTMAERAYRIIKQEQPNAIVLTPSATWRDGSPSDWFEKYFAASGGRYADAIAFHGYVGTEPEGLVTEISRIRSVAQKYGVDKPIWDTESSWGMDAKLSDPAAQAAFLARSYILHVAEGIGRFYWYAWDGSDGGSTPPDKSWGTLWDGSKGYRPAVQAYRTVHSWLDGVRLPLPCGKDDSVWRCELNGNSEIIWTPAGQRTLQLDKKYTRYVALDGQMHTVPATQVVVIGPSPILARSN